MATVEQIAEQVHGILVRNEIVFSVNQAGNSFRVMYESTAAFVDVIEFGNRPIVAVRATVLQDVDATGERELAVLRRVNRENASSFFGALWLSGEGTSIVLDYHLAAEDLQASELMAALSNVVNRADHLDDVLIEELGTGERWVDVEARAQADQAAEPAISA